MEVISGVAWAISIGSVVAGYNFFNKTSKMMGILLFANAFVILYLHNSILNERELDGYQAEMNAWAAENYY
jgi:hypothetical protein